MSWMRPLQYLSAIAAALVLSISVARAELISVEIIGDNDYIPYSYEDDGQAQGIYVNILREAFKRVRGFDVKIRMLPWKRGLALVARGDGFAIFPPYYFPEQRPYMQPYSQPMLLEQVSIFCRDSVMGRPRSKWPDDFYNLRIGNNQGFLTPGPAFFGAVNAGLIQLNEVTDTNTGLRMLVHGRIDCFVNDRRAIQWELQALQRSGRYDPDKHHIQEATTGAGHWAYIGYTNKQPERYPFKEDFVRQMDEILKDMHSTGEIDRIADQFFGS
ncbi:substrate-binding periplasmic protein [Aestuariispira ectoiniformans]|uniref:substrate-binding periplasmic protein n=1 Tax=Aestuariispira ectoiniformans TaxID=2775080 RepID=UPI00223C3DAE|nr:transporter substrate-binding domain-containing protein [Aestuariispira ectoiniformans]